MARTWHRWLPAGAVVALVAGTVTVTSQAGAVDLPDKSPEDVLTMLAEHQVEAFSGTFQTSTDLGLPLLGDIDLGPGGPDLDDADLDVPDDAGGAGATVDEGPVAAEATGAGDVAAALELLTGDNTGRVFVAGPGVARFQHLDGLDERNVVVNERDVWFYDTETNEATHLVLPDPADLPASGKPEPANLKLERHGSLHTPEELASAAVTALEPSTELTVGQHERVAGRDAYTLSLTPRAAETLVDAVTISVDGETGFPLGVTVTARGQAEPALQAEYTEIDFSAPDASLFDFSPPAGVVVEQEILEVPDAAGSGHEPAGPDGPDGDVLGPDGDVLGEGWGAVAVLPAGDAALADHPLLTELTEEVDGGRLLSTALVSVLLTDDGRLLAGAVTPEHLQALAGR